MQVYSPDKPTVDLLEQGLEHLTIDSRETLARHIGDNPILVSLILSLSSETVESDKSIQWSGVGSNVATLSNELLNPSSALREFITASAARSQLSADTYYEVSGNMTESGYQARVELIDTALRDFLGDNAKKSVFEIHGNIVADKGGDAALALRVHSLDQGS